MPLKDADLSLFRPAPLPAARPTAAASSPRHVAVQRLRDPLEDRLGPAGSPGVAGLAPVNRIVGGSPVPEAAPDQQQATPTGVAAWLPWGDRHPLASMTAWLGFCVLAIQLRHLIQTLDPTERMWILAGIAAGVALIIERWRKPDMNWKRLKRRPSISRILGVEEDAS